MITDKKQSIIELTFVAFDIETTGLMPVVKRIAEIGAVKFRLGKVVETFQLGRGQGLNCE